MSHRKTDLELEQTIFLGGQVSGKHKDFQTIARLSPDYAEIYVLLDKLPELLTKKNPVDLTKTVIELLGEVDLMRSTTELTRLSMILGDTRKSYSFKGIKKVVASK